MKGREREKGTGTLNRREKNCGAPTRTDFERETGGQNHSFEVDKFFRDDAEGTTPLAGTKKERGEAGFFGLGAVERNCDKTHQELHLRRRIGGSRVSVG